MTTKQFVPCFFLGLVALGAASCSADNTATPGNNEKAGESSTVNDSHSGAGGGSNSAGSSSSAGSSNQNQGSGGTGAKETGGGGDKGTGGAAGNATKGSGGSGPGQTAGGDGAGGKGAGSGKGTGGTTKVAGDGGAGAGSAKGGSTGTGGGGSTNPGGDGCITIKTKSMSSQIPTVGIVEFSTAGGTPTEAHIEFGLDTKYGLTAPVDLKETNYHTLLLGMKAGKKTYHFRVVAKVGDKECTSLDDTLPATGDPPTSLPDLSFKPDPAQIGGFLVLETYKQSIGMGGGDSPAYILDSDGDFVWWYVVKGVGDLTRAKQSYDGKYMWIAKGNVGQGDDGSSNAAKVYRVSMDGSKSDDFSSGLAHLNHDFAVRSDETVAFVAYESGTSTMSGCDDIKEFDPNTKATKKIANSGDLVGAQACHCNAIHYDRNDDTIVFSELDSSSIVKIKRDGTLVWLMSSQNASKSTVSGLTWTKEHNFHIIDDTHLLFFNNNTGPNAQAIEAELAISGGKGTAKQVWNYPSTLTDPVMGDVQRLKNGNTLVTFSLASEIREVNTGGTVQQSIKINGTNNYFGYAEFRESLYGPPPR